MILSYQKQRALSEANQELIEAAKEDQKFIDQQSDDLIEFKKQVAADNEKRDREIEESKERMKELEGEKEQVEKERDEYKTRVKTMPSNVIVEEIGERIGSENIRFTAAGTYELTREGANRVLFRFKDGESSETNYQKQLKLTKEAVDNYEKEHKSRLAVEATLKKADKLIEDQKEQIANLWNTIDGLEKELAAKKRATLIQQALAGGIGYLAGAVIH